MTAALSTASKSTASTYDPDAESTQIERIDFETNEQAQSVCGIHDQNLVRIEHHLNVQLTARGMALQLKGPKRDMALALALVRALQHKALRHDHISPEDVDIAYRFVANGENAPTYAAKPSLRQRANGPERPTFRQPEEAKVSVRWTLAYG